MNHDVLTFIVYYMRRSKVTEKFVYFCHCFSDVGLFVFIVIVLLCVCKNFNSEAIDELRVSYIPCLTIAIVTLVLVEANLQLQCSTDMQKQNAPTTL